MNMVERVRESMKAQFSKTIEESAGIPFKDTGVIMPNDELWNGYARAAIEAMKEPTERMKGKGCERDDGGDRTNALGVDQAMITAALEE